MTTKRNFKSDAFEAIHTSARALHKVGAISKVTLREFDESCLTMPAECEKARLDAPVQTGHRPTSETKQPA